MSANIYWQPLLPTANHLDVSCPSQFMESLSVAFGTLPVTLTQANIPVLEGMAAASNEDAYREIIHLLQDLGSIEITATY